MRLCSGEVLGAALMMKLCKGNSVPENYYCLYFKTIVTNIQTQILSPL